ncbi:Imidazole glycerol phosphate synthase amidotransferase subunit [hydrothermal vent metagenome]|uniref:Imidazole glycerol phosphate synthase amidotransferase subunit n=1 Tax=hydrothermal vent metagenome TaxID=652676 RepID=A0A3B0RLQ1_9ZZZZ
MPPMKKKIAIIDYDMGNLLSVSKALEKVTADTNAEVIITRDPSVIADASHIVLPGVGAFKECMHNLETYDLIEPIKKAVTSSGKPFLGICLGMQLLFEEGLEDCAEGQPHKGLALIKGSVVAFPTDMEQAGERLKVPHMGWNSIDIKKDSPLLENIEDGSFFYFVHTYYCAPTGDGVTLTKTNYGFDFTSSLAVENIVATQFHPEKSQKVGLHLLKNFTEMN